MRLVSGVPQSVQDMKPPKKQETELSVYKIKVSTWKCFIYKKGENIHLLSQAGVFFLTQVNSKNHPHLQLFNYPSGFGAEPDKALTVPRVCVSEMTHFPMLHYVVLPTFNTQQVELVQNVSCHCPPVFRDRRRGSRSRKIGRLFY